MVQILGGETGVAQAGIHRGKQTAHHRHQMRRELKADLLTSHLHRHLLDLRGVAMADHAVGRDGFRGLRQQHRLLRHARPPPEVPVLASMMMPLVSIRPCLRKGQQGQQAGGGEATWSGHKLRVSDGRAVPFRQAVNGTAAELASS